MHNIYSLILAEKTPIEVKLSCRQFIKVGNFWRHHSSMNREFFFCVLRKIYVNLAFFIYYYWICIECAVCVNSASKFLITTFLILGAECPKMVKKYYTFLYKWESISAQVFWLLKHLNHFTLQCKDTGHTCTHILPLDIHILNRKNSL